MGKLENMVGNGLQTAITCSKLTLKTLEQGVNYVQSSLLTLKYLTPCSFVFNVNVEHVMVS